MTLNQSISELINSEYHRTDESVISVSLGRKVKNGQETGEDSIVYGVKKKIPLDQISSDKLLPRSFIIDDRVIKTDVVELGRVRFLAGCWGAWRYVDADGDGDFDSVSEVVANASKINPHRSLTRPLKAGVTILNFAEKFNATTRGFSIGTMGLICVDNDTNTLVGLTNNHVIIKNAFIASERDPASTAWSTLNGLNVTQNGISYSVPNGVTQMSESDFGLTNSVQFITNNIIGKVKKYQPLISNANNYVDVAVFTLNSNAINYSESFKQLGLPINTPPMAFATTQEINNLVTADNDLISCGRTTGAKGIDGCLLRSNGVGASILVENIAYSKYDSPTGSSNVDFADCISIVMRDPLKDTPLFAGDSGSALIANINGTLKIIGLVFAGSFNDNGICTRAYACRIDRIASAMNLSAWDGSIIPVDNPTSEDVQYVNNLSNSVTQTINNKKYWQIGTA